MWVLGAFHAPWLLLNRLMLVQYMFAMFPRTSQWVWPCLLHFGGVKKEEKKAIKWAMSGCVCAPSWFNCCMGEHYFGFYIEMGKPLAFFAVVVYLPHLRNRDATLKCCTFCVRLHSLKCNLVSEMSGHCWNIMEYRGWQYQEFFFFFFPYHQN